MRGTSGTGTVKQFRVRGFRRVGSSQKAFWKFVCHKEQEIFVVTADNVAQHGLCRCSEFQGLLCLRDT